MIDTEYMTVMQVLSLGPGPYKYMTDLLYLESKQPPFPMAPELTGGGESPLLPYIQNWQFHLRDHPDAQYQQYLLKGLTEGFRVGFDWSQQLSSAKQNMPSVTKEPQVVQDYIKKECAAGSFIGPFSSPTLSNGQNIQVSRIGIIPKGHNTGKWRLITDLSFPENASVNDGIAPERCSLEYITVDKVAAKAIAMGKGTLLAKIDIKSAYRLVPIHPADRQLLGISWQGGILVDTKLPFGLRSAPKIFNALADAFEWCIEHQGVSNVAHYLDDFITFGPPLVCTRNLKTIKKIAAELGIPLAEDKEEGPTTTLTFLGIKINTVEGTLSLPEDKVKRLQRELDSWNRKRCCRRRELESLLGLLHHAARVVRPGRSFVHRLVTHLRGRRQGNHFIRLNREARRDLRWWQMFLESWNGVSILPTVRPVASLTSDASGGWGCGAFTDQQKWFQLPWPTECIDADICFKEMLPIVLAVMTWGHTWRGYQVGCKCDNQAVVNVLSTRYSRSSPLMHLLRCLFFFEAYYDLYITASHIPGKDNTLADYLSRDQLSLFLMQAPDMPGHASPLPLMAMDLLLDPAMDWSSPAWIPLFKSIVL